MNIFFSKIRNISKNLRNQKNLKMPKNFQEKKAKFPKFLAIFRAFSYERDEYIILKCVGGNMRRPTFTENVIFVRRWG